MDTSKHNEVLPIPDRFWSKVNKTATCWLWTASLTYNGYPRYGYKGKTVRAHRFVYELVNGQIPDGLTIDHLCKVRHCVNPTHLEAVSMRENVLRGDTITAKNTTKTHCPQGHLYKGDNLYLHPTGSRICKECNRQAQQKYKLKPGVKERYKEQRRDRRMAYG